MRNKRNALMVCGFIRMMVLIAAFALFYVVPTAAQTRPDAPPKEKDPYKIGTTLAVTGFAASLGVNARNAIVMAVDEINSRGGINGHRLEGVIYDNKSDDSTAVLSARKLIEKDKVDALIVGSTSGSCFAVLDTSERSKTPMVSITAAIKLWKPTRPYSFSVVPGVDIQERVRAKWIKQQGYSKVGIFWLTGAYGEECVEYFEQEAKNFGLRIVANEQHKGTDTDTSVQLSSIVAAKPDVIWVSSYPHSGSIIAKNAKSLGIGVPLLACYGMTSETWLNLSGKAAEGWNGCIVSHVLGELTPPSKPTYSIVKAYAEAFHKRFGESITSTSGNAYDGVYVIGAGLKAIGEEPDLGKRREKLARAIERLDNFFGLNGPYYLSPGNHNGIGESAVSIVKIVNEKMTLIE